MDPIVIIGTGLAGYGTARELRKHDPDTPLVMLTRDDGAYYYKPDLSEAFTKENAPDDLIKKPVEAMADELDADIRTHVEVESVETDGHRVTVSGETLAYSKLVLAWGADPIDIPLGGDATDEIHQVNNLTDYRSFRTRLTEAKDIAIMGAGLIGCEFANDLTNAGYHVTNIDPIDWPLARFLPEPCGRALQEALKDNGVDWRLGVTVDTVSHANGGIRIELSDGDDVQADVVLSACGLRPGVTLAEDAGIRTDRGIVVDKHLATSAPDVYALGDCAEVEGTLLPFVMPLMNAARALGKTLADEATAVRYPVMPVIVKTPACPTLVYQPRGDGGEWEVVGDAPDLEARYTNGSGELVGFALTGEATKKRRDYIKEAPPVLT